MTEAVTEDDRLFGEALDLMIRLQNDPANPVARDLVRSWRARGADHEAVWAEVTEIHGMAGKVLTDQRKAAQPGTRMSRRNMILGGAVAVAAAGASAAYGPDTWLRLQADHVTATAELRRVALTDGSTVTLGPKSAIRSAFAPTERRVELLAGMAFFDVADDPARPFRATLDRLSLSSFGGAFDLSRDTGFDTMSVGRGSVDATLPNAMLSSSVTLVQGDVLSWDDDLGKAERSKRDLAQIAAWRDSMIVAERETVAAVTSRIRRWYNGRIVIADASLGAQRISGVFDLKDPIMALEAVVHPYGAKIRQLSPWLTVVSTI
ncbi:DUF4974 domain-containing protein [Tardiphaga alba]|uniref:DUF4974 domain-containing protein n=1 Tax=Tardiphaga alba TaxID=340268 RepID=A0ABX8A837_9BRAD|nr:FecR domain-containing protein [Tardiphaga alba]QUS39823.1 DUF4974 domain-containing protein [Tardiphaga alba]